MISKNSNLKIL